MSLRALLLLSGVLSLIYFGLLSQFRIFGVVPNLPLLLVLILAMETEDFSFIAAALTAGLVADFYLGFPIGTFSGGLLLVGFVAHALFSRLHYGLTWRHQLALIVGSTFLISLWAVLYSQIVFSNHLPVPTLGWREAVIRLVPGILYNLILFPLLLRWFRKFQLNKPFLISSGLK